MLPLTKGLRRSSCRQPPFFSFSNFFSEKNILTQSFGNQLDLVENHCVYYCTFQNWDFVVLCQLHITFLGHLRDSVPSLLTGDHLRWASRSLPAVKLEVRKCNGRLPIHLDSRISLKSDNWTSFCLPSTDTWVMIGYIPQTKARQVYVVPKNVGLVSPDANPRPKPLGTKVPRCGLVGCFKNSLSAKSVMAGEKLVATYSIST